MKQRIITISAVLATLTAGSIAVFNWETGEVERVFDADWEFVDKADCDLAPCNNAACTAAKNHADDAGFSNCTFHFASCDFRVNARLRAAAAANGVTLGPQKYQRLRVGAERCALDGGGFAFGIALDDAGWPMLGTVVTATPKCVRAPLDGGTDCRRNGALLDGGVAFFGTGNVFPAAQAVGTQCEPCNCKVIFGDDPDNSL